jgi:hypothetical protein
MVEAMKDCCDNVWAIVEITGPDEGFDCNLLLDTGGTQFRSPNPKNKPNPNYSGSYPDLSENVKIGNDDSNRTDYSGRLNSLLAFGAESGVAVDNMWRSLLPSRFSPYDAIGQNRSESGSDDGQQDILNVVELRALMGLGPSVTVRMLPSAIPDTRNFE